MTDKSTPAHREAPGKKRQEPLVARTAAPTRHPNGSARRCQDDRRGTRPDEVLGVAHATRFRAAFCRRHARTGFAISASDTRAPDHPEPQGRTCQVDRIVQGLPAAGPQIDGARCHAITQAAMRHRLLSRAMPGTPERALLATLRARGPGAAT